MSSRCIVGILVAFGCGGSGGEVCITRADCQEDQICVNGECSLAAADAMVGDAARSDADVADSAPQGDAPEGDARSGCSLVCDPPRMCNPALGACVECLDDADCAGGRCAAGSCAGCDSSSQCTAPEAAACSSEGVCGPCASDADCAGVSVGGGAAASICDAGVCAECTGEQSAEEQSEACGGNSCNPSTNSCTTTPLGSVSSCGACVSDIECGAESACVEMVYGEAVHGTYCLQRAAVGCERGYRFLIDGESVSGLSDTFCGITEETTCEAFLAFGAACESTDDCPVGGVCESFGGMPICTSACNTSRDCPEFGGLSGSCDGRYCRPR